MGLGGQKMSKIRNIIETMVLSTLGIIFIIIIGLLAFGLYIEVINPPVEVVPPEPAWDLGKIEVYKYMYGKSAFIVLEVPKFKNYEQTLSMKTEKGWLVINDPSTKETRKVDLYTVGWNIYTREESVGDSSHKIMLELIQGVYDVPEDFQDP